MPQMYDCYNKDGNYIGLYFAENYEDLANKYKHVFYVAGEKALQTRKNWSKLTIEELDKIRDEEDVKHLTLPVQINEIEPIKDNSSQEEMQIVNTFEPKSEFPSFEELSNIEIEKIEVSLSPSWLAIKEKIKEKEQIKKNLLQNVRNIRKEIKELEQLLQTVQ